MELKNWINVEIPGDNFNLWDYDESKDIKKLKKNGYPYSLVYFDVNKNTIIVIGDAMFSKSPLEIIEKSYPFNFKLDVSKHPRKI